MKRALTIAAALIHEPRLLFLDEPTTGLDAAAARSLRSLISKLQEKGLTIFLTTHYLEEADLLCDRIAIMVRGKIVSLPLRRGVSRLRPARSAAIAGAALALDLHRAGLTGLFFCGTRFDVATELSCSPRVFDFILAPCHQAAAQEV